MKVSAYAAERPGARLRPHTYETDPLGPNEVDVRVTHCGVCHTDIAMLDDEWGVSRFPAVMGHEVVGVVHAVGDAVDTGRVFVGQRVGVPATAGSCHRCEWCLSGRQNLCPDKDDLVLRGDRGGFASHVRAGDWRQVQPIPEAIGSAHAAPLLCAGATVFAPLLRHRVLPTARVAVVGIGGLGHLALRFAANWGCAVTAISSSPDKAEDARRFGATDVIVTDRKDALRAAAGRFDFVLSTVSADLPWDDYLATLRPHGRLCVVGVPPRPIAVGPLNLLPGERMIAGGNVGSPVEIAQMLEFAARHGIRPDIETFGVAEIDTAIERVRQGAARYRAVVEF
jgi:uncharacterized zinc-type alcohol dehydrogenase-like protein